MEIFNYFSLFNSLPYGEIPIIPMSAKFPKCTQLIFYFVLGGSDRKESACNAETHVQSLGWEDNLEKETATQSSILAWRIPWTEESGGFQSMGLQRVGHDWVTNTFFHFDPQLWIITMTFPQWIPRFLIYGNYP